MKSIMRTVLLGALAMLALSGIAAASASANACITKAGSKNYQLCINRAKLSESTNVEIEGATTSPLVVTLNNEPSSPSIACEGLSDGGSSLVVSPTNPLYPSFTLSATKCKIKGSVAIEKDCEIGWLNIIDPWTGTLHSVESISVTGPGSDDLFNFSVRSKEGQNCTQFARQTEELTGTFECKVSSATVEAVEHELKCMNTERYEVHLRGFTDRSSISYTQMISLGGARKGDKFSIYEAS